jgi:heme A synthase
MIYFLALLPATVLTIAGYFVLYLSNRSEGTFRTFGKYLGIWAFTLAALVILGAIFAAARGRHHCPMWEREMYGRMHAHGDESSNPQSGATPQAPAGAPNPAAQP